MTYDKTFHEHFASSRLLANDPEAQNLAWLLFRPGHKFPPDAQFTTHVRRSLQMDVTTGAVDLSGLIDEGLTIRPLLRLPPPAAARGLTRLHSFHDLPVVQAYFGWARMTIESRARMWQDYTFDNEFMTLDVDLVASVLAPFRLQ